MGLTYGFFNSLNHDRMYSAEDMAGFLDGIVYDGVYEAVGNKFYVQAYDGMKVTVDSGRAWLDHTWTLNTTKYVLELPESDTVYDRIDAVVLEVNKSDRRNYFKVVQGTPVSNPQRPSLIKTNLVKQYALAYITVPRYASVITQQNITYVVGSSETPLCSALALSGIPSGGLTGQVLAKSSGESGAINWYNINLLPSDKWYLPMGVTEDDVIAAFQFRYAESEDEAIKSINRNLYVLTKTSQKVTWSGFDGMRIPNEGNQGLNNSSITGSPIGTVAVKYANAEGGDKHVSLIYKDESHFILAKDYTIAGNAPTYYDPEETAPNVPYYQNIKRPVIASGNRNDPGFDNFTQDGIASYYSSMIAENTASGIISCNFSNDTPVMFFNRSVMSLSSSRITYDGAGGNQDGETWTHHYASGTPVLGGPLIGSSANNVQTYGSVHIHLVVFYNRILNENEMIGLHNLMMNI